MKRTRAEKLELTGRQTLPVAALDSFLAVDRAAFARVANRWIARLDAADVTLEFEPIPTTDESPLPLEAVGPGILSTYRAEVERVLPMNREDEVRLARRFDLVRRRYRGALSRAGLFARPVAAAKDPTWFYGACDHGGNGGTSSCLYSDAPAGRLEELHARRREYDAARNAMVERTLWLVLRLVERYRSVGAGSLDLLQEGSASLFRAVEGYEWWRNVRFTTYATFWVNQAFLNLLYKTGRTVRVPAYLQKAMKKINAARMAAGSPDLGADAIARSSGLSEDLVRRVLSNNRYSLSLDRELWSEGVDDGRRLLDLLEDEKAGIDLDAMEDPRLGDRLKEAMECLKPRERTIVEMRFGLNGARPHTLAEVGRMLGISLERVRQIQEGALRRMRAGRGRALLASLVA